MTAGDADGLVLATLVITGRPPIDMTAPVTIGRDPRADRGDMVAIDGDPLVSKSHLAMDIGADGLVITDLGSSNGTFLHHRGSETAVPTDSWVPVPAGAEVEFGDQRMTIEVPRAPDSFHADDAETPRHGIAAPVPPVAPPDPWGPAAVADIGIRCAHCDRQLSPASNFCDGCGTPTARAAAPPVTGPVPASAPTDVDPGTTVIVPAASAQPPIGLPAGAAPPPSPPSPPSPFDPGQPGARSFVDLSSEAQTRRGPRNVIVVVVAAVVILGVVAFVLSRVVSGDDDTGRQTVPFPQRIPGDFGPGDVRIFELDVAASQTVRLDVEGDFIGSELVGGFRYRVDDETDELAGTYEFVVYDTSGDESTTYDVMTSSG